MIPAAIAAALGECVALVNAEAGRAVEQVVAELRATRTDERDAILLLIGSDVPVLDRALLRAAIGPLAVELAPAKRINAVDITRDAAEGDVIAAARFLATAGSTTGQLIELR